MKNKFPGCPSQKFATKYFERYVNQRLEFIPINEHRFLEFAKNKGMDINYAKPGVDPMVVTAIFVAPQVDVEWSGFLNPAPKNRTLRLVFRDVCLRQNGRLVPWHSNRQTNKKRQLKVDPKEIHPLNFNLVDVGIEE